MKLTGYKFRTDGGLDISFVRDGQEVTRHIAADVLRGGAHRFVPVLLDAIFGPEPERKT